MADILFPQSGNQYKICEGCKSLTIRAYSVKGYMLCDWCAFVNNIPTDTISRDEFIAKWVVETQYCSVCGADTANPCGCINPESERTDK